MTDPTRPEQDSALALDHTPEATPLPVHHRPEGRCTAMMDGIPDPESARNRINAWQSRIDSLAANTKAMSDQMQEVRVTVTDPDKMVEVTVDGITGGPHPRRTCPPAADPSRDQRGGLRRWWQTDTASTPLSECQQWHLLNGGNLGGG